MREHGLPAHAVERLDLVFHRAAGPQPVEQVAPTTAARQGLAQAGRRQHHLAIVVAHQEQCVFRPRHAREFFQGRNAVLRCRQAGRPLDGTRHVHGQAAMTRTTAVQLWNPLNCPSARAIWP